MDMNENKEKLLGESVTSDESAEKTETAEEIKESEPALTEEQAEESEEPKSEAEETKNEPPKKSKKLLWALGIALAVVVLSVLCLAAGFVAYTVRPVSVEAGEEFSLDPLYETAFLSSLVEVRSVPEDLSKPDDYAAKLRFFGFLEWDLLISVVDTIPPSVDFRTIHLLEGVEAKPEDFVLSYEDCSSVSFAFKEQLPVHTAGKQTVEVIAADEYGNTASYPVEFTVWDGAGLLSVDLNTTTPEHCLKELFPEITETVVDGAYENVPGRYAIRAFSADAMILWEFHPADAVKPSLEVRDLSIRLGETAEAEDFVVSLSDVSPCKVSFVTEPSFEKAGLQTVGVMAEDSFGNRTEAEVRFLICHIPEAYRAEYGFSPADAEQALLQEVGELFACSYPADEKGCLPVGSYDLVYESEWGDFTVALTVEDTTAPRLLLEDITLYEGEHVTASDFVVKCVELSKVAFTAVMEKDGITAELSAKEAGVYTISVTATDASGNTTTEAAALTVVADTEAPVIHGVADLTIYVGQSIPLDGVYAVDNRDRKAEVVADTSAVDCSVPGVYTVLYSCTDASGNQAKKEATVEVLPDTEPPVIFGAQNLAILAGESVSFRKNVYAIDAQCGSLTVKVDSSAVNTYAEGVYPVHYTCTDFAGNTASQTVYLTVTALTSDKVNAMADQILSWIVTPSMSVYEKAWAVYAWCTGNLQYSTRTSYLMGQFVESAYSGLTTRSGNCYVYYAVASVLLTRVGIENIEIHRNDPDNPHYWNLVKVNGSWYHFDTCPHYAGHWLQSFLLTDAEVRAYSQYQVPGYYDFDASLYPPTP